MASPQDAVSLLGYDTVRALVLSAKIFSQVDLQRIPGFWLDALWQHSFSTALFARAIGVGEKLPRKAQDEAFTAGILHDLGKLILAQNFPDDYTEAIARSDRHNRPLWEVEIERFGASPAELGAYLLGLWGVGEDVVAAVAQHHQPPPAGGAARVTAVVYAANLLERRLAAEPSVEELPGGEVEILSAASRSTSASRPGRTPAARSAWRRRCVHNRVLFVDDDPKILAALRRQLRKKVEIETVTSGRDGLDTIRREGPFSVVVTTTACPR